MGLFTWATRNWAETSDNDPKLAPLLLPLPREQASAHIRTTIENMPRWQVLSFDANGIKATRRTRLFRFVDDVSIRLEAASDASTRVHVHSQSRVGKGDLGQNRRNIIELLRAVAKNH